MQKTCSCSFSPYHSSPLMNRIMRKGGIFMGYYGGNVGNYNDSCGNNNYGGNGSSFVLIVVLFILLIIVGASFMSY